MSEFMELERRFEDTVTENAKFAGEVVRATTKAVGDRDDETEGFLRAVYVGALSKANTKVRRVLLSFAR